MAVTIKSLIPQQIKLLQDIGGTDWSENFLEIYKKYFSEEAREILLSSTSTPQEKNAEERLQEVAKYSYKHAYSQMSTAKAISKLAKAEYKIKLSTFSKRFLQAVSNLEDSEKIHIYIVPIGFFGGCSAMYHNRSHVFLNPSPKIFSALSLKQTRTLLVHEFIHAHHVNIADLNISDAGWDSKLHYALFMEGLATFFVKQFCGDLSFEEAVCREQLSLKEKKQIAAEILEQLDKKITSRKYKETLREYFFGSPTRPRKELCKGYALGYELIENSGETFENLCKLDEGKMKEFCVNGLKAFL